MATVQWVQSQVVAEIALSKKTEGGPPARAVALRLVMGGAIITCVCSPKREQGRILAAVKCWDIIADKQPMAHRLYLKYGSSSRTISARPAGVGAASQRLIPTGERSGLLTCIAMTESVSLCEQMKYWLGFWNCEGRYTSSR